MEPQPPLDDRPCPSRDKDKDRRQVAARTRTSPSPFWKEDPEKTVTFTLPSFAVGSSPS